MKTWIILALVVGIFTIGTVVALSATGNVVSEPSEVIGEECQYANQGGCTQEKSCGNSGCGIKTTGSCGCGK